MFPRFGTPDPYEPMEPALRYDEFPLRIAFREQP
jgi:hypothetical protein